MSSPNKISRSSTITANNDCLSTTLDGESVVLHMGNGKYYGFNEVGTSIWEIVQEPQTIEEVCNAILEEYDVSEERCMNDVVELIRDMIGKNLVHVVEK